MRTKKAVVGVAVLCLVAGAMAAPAVAKKNRKPVRGSQTFYLVQRGEADCDVDGKGLSLTPSSENFGQCWPVGAGPLNETYQTVGGPCDPVAEGTDSGCDIERYPAFEGVPLRLDASAPMTGTIHVSSMEVHGDVPGLGAGPATLDLAVTGTVAGKHVLIGAYSTDYVVTPPQKTYEIPFEMEVDPAYDKSTLTSLRLNIWSSGVTAVHGIYRPDDSTLVLPVWK